MRVAVVLEGCNEVPAYVGVIDHLDRVDVSTGLPITFAHARRSGTMSTVRKSRSRFAKILDPALRREHREVGAEKHLVLELGICVLHQLRWEIRRRPTGQIDEHVGFVRHTDNASSCQGQDG